MKIIKRIALGLFTSIFLTAGLLAAAAAVCNGLRLLPRGYETLIICVIAGLSALLGAFLTAKIAGEKGLLLGMAIGTLYFLLLLCLCAIFSEETSLPMVLSRGAVVFFAGALGGSLGVNQKKKLKF